MTDIYAAGPVHGGRATNPYRIVLRRTGDDPAMSSNWVVHTEVFMPPPDSSRSYTSGSYYSDKEHAIREFCDRVSREAERPLLSGTIEEFGSLSSHRRWRDVIE